MAAPLGFPVAVAQPLAFEPNSRFVVAVWMTLLVLGVGLFVPFVAIKMVLGQLVLRLERDDALWVALAGHCASIVLGAPQLALLWWTFHPDPLSRTALATSPSILIISLFYACLVIPFDVWTAQGTVRGGNYPELDDGHPASTLSHRWGFTTLELVGVWSLVSNLVCIGAAVLFARYFSVVS